MRRHCIFVMSLLPALGAAAQYVGKVGHATAPAPALRATAVYQYTGSMAKPNASRLVPVVVWDGSTFQPGGLYLARPEPLTVARGTQYVLTPNGVPGGLFDVLSASQQDGAWVGLGRYAVPAPPAPGKLRAAKTLPELRGNRRHDSNTDDTGGPVLHRRAGSESDSSPASQTAQPAVPDNGPVLHRRAAPTPTNPAPTAPAQADPDRPVLHKAPTTPAADPERPILHARSTPPSAEAVEADPDRPHLRYGRVAATGVVAPALLQTRSAKGGAAPEVSQVVAISDVAADEPHSFAYNWLSPADEAQTRDTMHALALQALVASLGAGFGPAAGQDAALCAAAATPRSPGSFGPHTQASASAPDPLAGAEFHAYTLSYAGDTAFVYSAHTLAEGAARRYVTVIASPDFYGKPHAIFTATTRSDTLAQTPALHLIDAVDADGDHRAELLFAEQTTPDEQPATARQFALFRIADGQAQEVYSSGPAQP